MYNEQVHFKHTLTPGMIVTPWKLGLKNAMVCGTTAPQNRKIWFVMNMTTISFFLFVLQIYAFRLISDNTQILKKAILLRFFGWLKSTPRLNTIMLDRVKCHNLVHRTGEQVWLLVHLRCFTYKFSISVNFSFNNSV